MRIVKHPGWKEAIAALTVVEQRLPSWIDDQIGDAVDPIVNRAQAAAMRVNIQGGPAGSTGLRGRVAAGVGVRKGLSTKKNAYYRIYTSMTNVAESPIPRGMDSPKGWRHPLWGNKNYWYQSRPTNPGWFTDTVSDGADDIERAIGRALDRAEKLAG